MSSNKRISKRLRCVVHLTTCDVLKSSTTSVQIAKLLRSFRRENFLGRSSCAKQLPAWQAAANSGAVSWTKVTELMRWYRVGSSNCSSHNLPQIPTNRLPLLCKYVVGFSEVHLRLCRNFSWFHTKESLHIDHLSAKPSQFECLSEVMLGDLVFLTLTEVPCQTSCPYFCPCKTAHANHHLHRCFSFNDFVCSTGSSCRIILHVQNDFPFAPCSLQTLHRVVSSMTMTSVKSVFPSSLCNNSAVHACSSETCSLILKQFCFKLLSVKSFFLELKQFGMRLSLFCC